MSNMEFHSSIYEGTFKVTSKDTLQDTVIGEVIASYEAGGRQVEFTITNGSVTFVADTVDVPEEVSTVPTDKVSKIK